MSWGAMLSKYCKHCMGKEFEVTKDQLGRGVQMCQEQPLSKDSAVKNTAPNGENRGEVESTRSVLNISS